MDTYSNFRVDGRCKVINPSTNEMVGMISGLLQRCGLDKSKGIRYLERVVREAALHQQIQLFFSEDRDLVGYVVWALLAEETEKRILATGTLDLHPSEWTEGSSLWIVDLVLLRGRFPHVCKVLRDETFAKAKQLRYAKQRLSQLQVVELQRGRTGTFLNPIGPYHGRLCRCGISLADCAMIVT